MGFPYARPPPPPPPSSDPHQRPPQQTVPPPPGTFYPGQFQYHSPSHPPPQWAPQTQHSDHQLPPPHPYAVTPPLPMPYSSSPYPLPPRPHMTVPPPHPHYPPVNQEWSNTNWGHQAWDQSAHNKNEDDWAARARAWAASKTDDKHQQSQSIPANRPEETNYQDQYAQNLNPPYTESQQPSLPPSSYQQYSSSFAPPPRTPANHLQEPSSFTSGYTSDGNFSYTTRDGNAAFPQQEPAPTSLSAHQQEVPSSYSSIPGKEESRETNGNFYQPSSHMPSFASAPQHQIQPPISPVSIEQQSHYSFSNPTTSDVSNQPLDFVPRFSHDHDPVGATSTGMHPVTSYGRMLPGHTTFPIGTSNAFGGFPVDTYGFPDRNKKSSVPNWLREEIIKKKAVIGSSTMEVSRQETESNEDEVMMDGKSMESTEEEDGDEDYVEAARTAAINQEIKRILTEVLLKVTDELFDEIATKVLEEDTLPVKVEHKSIASSDMVPAIPSPKSSAKVLIPSKTKGDDTSRNSNSNSNSSLPGDVLGLGNYASDDDDDEVQNLSIPSSINNNKPTENGSSQVDGSKLLEKKSDSQNGNLQSKNSSQADNFTQENNCGDDEKVVSDGKHQVLVEGVTVTVSANNSLPDDSQGEINNKSGDKRRPSSKDYNEEVEKAHTKVVENNNNKNNNNRIEDERNIEKVIKKDDRNGSKDKIKDQDSGKRSDKKEIERDRKRSHHDKEDGRKRERTKDERSSSRHKRHQSYASSDSSSDDSRRRKGHSKRRNSSPSPVRSRRQVSRSPPTKRSQHNRHSKYSSLETSRERKRSRSRSRRG